MCRAQHLDRYLEGQGHSMTLQQNRVRPVTYLKSDFTKQIDKLLICAQYLFGEHYTVRPALV